MLLRLLGPILLLLGVGFAVPQLLPRTALPAGEAGIAGQHALQAAENALGDPLDRLAIRSLEVLQVSATHQPTACPYRTELLARSWFGEPYARVTVSCGEATVSRD